MMHTIVEYTHRKGASGREEDYMVQHRAWTEHRCLKQIALEDHIHLSPDEILWRNCILTRNGRKGKTWIYLCNFKKDLTIINSL